MSVFLLEFHQSLFSKLPYCEMKILLIRFPRNMFKQSKLIQCYIRSNWKQKKKQNDFQRETVESCLAKSLSISWFDKLVRIVSFDELIHKIAQRGTAVHKEVKHPTILLWLTKSGHSKMDSTVNFIQHLVDVTTTKIVGFIQAFSF